jgi:hypothetical protein
MADRLANVPSDPWQKYVVALDDVSDRLKRRVAGAESSMPQQKHRSVLHFLSSPAIPGESDPGVAAKARCIRSMHRLTNANRWPA